ncbi:MAG: O-antigen ligase family protein [Chloroflexota bacterium]
MNLRAILPAAYRDPQAILWLLAALSLGLVIGLASTGQLIALLCILAAVGFGLAALRYPIILVGLLLAIGPTAAYEKRAGLPFIGTLSSVSTGQLFMAALLLFYGLWLLINRRTGLPRFKMALPLGVWLTFTLLSTLLAESRTVALKEWFKWIEVFLLIAITLDLSSLIPSKSRRLMLLVLLLLASAVLQGGIGLRQFLDPNGPESFQILGRFFRAFGTFEQPNPYGGFLSWHLLLGAGILAQYGYHQILPQLFYSKRNTDPAEGIWQIPWGFLAIILGASFIIGIGIVASWSRGAWLALFAGLGTIAFFLPKRRSTGVLLILGLAGLLIIAALSGLIPDSVTNRIASSTDFQIVDMRDVEVQNENYALYERLGFWYAAFGMFRDHLWFGVGFGNYDTAYADYFVNIWEQSLGHAHNYYINLLAEIGILGLITYVLFWGAVLVLNLSQLERSSPLARGILIGLLGVWVAISVHHLVDKLYVNNIYLNLAVMFALQ